MTFDNTNTATTTIPAALKNGALNQPVVWADLVGCSDGDSLEEKLNELIDSSVKPVVPPEDVVNEGIIPVVDTNNNLHKSDTTILDVKQGLASLEQLHLAVNKNASDIDATTMRVYRDGGYNMNNCLWYGHYFGCTSGRPEGSTEPYSLIVLNAGNVTSDIRLNLDVSNIIHNETGGLGWDGTFGYYTVENTQFVERCYGNYPSVGEEICSQIIQGIPNGIYTLSIAVAASSTALRDTWMPLPDTHSTAYSISVNGDNQLGLSGLRTELNSLDDVQVHLFNNVYVENNTLDIRLYAGEQNTANWFILRANSLLLLTLQDSGFMVIKQICYSSKDNHKLYSRLIYTNNRNKYTLPNTIYTPWVDLLSHKADTSDVISVNHGITAPFSVDSGILHLHSNITHSNIIEILDREDYNQSESGWEHAPEDATLCTIGVIKQRCRLKETKIELNDLNTAVQTSLSKADTALQQHQDISGKANISDIPTKVSLLTNDATYATIAYADSKVVDALDDSHDKAMSGYACQAEFARKTLVPPLASSNNQLADKEFVNSSITTATADFKGTVNSTAALNDFVNVDNNDYAFVVTVDTDGNTVYKRYKYNGTNWVFEYDLNNSSFTAALWAAILSGITQALVNKLNDLPSATTITAGFNQKVDKINGMGLSTNDYTSTEKAKLAGIAENAEVNVLSDWNQTNTSAKDFIKNKPTIPDITGKAEKSIVPNDITRTNTDATFVYKDSSNNLTPLFYLQQANASLAGLMTATDKAALDSLLINIETKATKVNPTTAGNIAGLDSTGNLTDSGIAATEIVKSTTARTIQTLTQAEFDALTSYDTNVEYNIV